LRKLLSALLLLAAGAMLGVGAVGYGAREGSAWLSGVAGGLFGTKPDVQSIASSSLDAVRTQSRLTAFVARFTVAVTSSQERFGLSARKTMIVPGIARYELDLAKLGPDSLRWSEADRTLAVTIPDIEVAAPQVDGARVQEYREGRLLLSLTDAEKALDHANRTKVNEALAAEARSPTLRRMAREATRSSVEQMFSLPLAAAGVEARVQVRFADEAAASS
jgi:hypothetical protein